VASAVCRSASTLTTTWGYVLGLQQQFGPIPPPNRSPRAGGGGAADMNRTHPNAVGIHFFPQAVGAACIACLVAAYWLSPPLARTPCEELTTTTSAPRLLPAAFSAGGSDRVRASGVRMSLRTGRRSRPVRTRRPKAWTSPPALCTRWSSGPWLSANAAANVSRTASSVGSSCSATTVPGPSASGGDRRPRGRSRRDRAVAAVELGGGD